MKQTYGNAAFDLKTMTCTLSMGSVNVTLDAHAMCYITQGYECMCTADYLKSNHGIKTDKRAWALAEKIRSLMNDDGLTESEAIDEALA